MSDILYAWEFGANLGHVGAFMPLAKALRDGGHSVHWAVTQPAQVGQFLASESFAWLPAPVMPEQVRPGPPLSYADILLRFGYADAGAMFGLVGAWRELIRVTRASLVLTDHAPTAVLAARTLNLPVMIFSNGFTVPPRIYPLPNMRPWQPVNGDVLARLDDTACQAINKVLLQYGQDAIAHAADLFSVAEETLVSFPELDHYPDRGPSRYWGCLPSSGAGKTIEWSGGDAPKVFAYLRPEVRHHVAVLEALAGLPVVTRVFFPGCDPALRARLESERLRFLEHPADLGKVSREVSLAVTYGGLATTTAFLLAGKPLLLLPGHLEQFLSAARVVDMGAGVLVNPEGPPGDLVPVVRQLLEQPSYRQNAEAFAMKYKAFDQGQVMHNLIRRINELLDQSAES